MVIYVAVYFLACRRWPFKAWGGDTARLGRDSDHRCQVVKLKILSDVHTQAAEAGWGGGRKAPECFCPTGGGAVGSEVWWVTLGS